MAKLFKESAGAEGIFISEGVIKEIKPNDNPGQYPKDINYMLTLEIAKEDGSTFERGIFLSGNLFKNGDIPPNLSHFLYAIGIEEEPNQGLLLDAFCASEDNALLKQFCLNKRIKILSFVSGTYESNGETKPSYRVWDGRQKGFKNLVNVWDVKTENKTIIKKFFEQMDTDYPPKYTPEVLETKTELDKTEEVEDEVDSI